MQKEDKGKKKSKEKREDGGNVHIVFIIVFSCITLHGSFRIDRDGDRHFESRRVLT
jgi:hypothetical protein